MQLPPHIKNNPDYLLLSEYYEPEQVARIIASGIPVNRPGVVPSLQVPPGAKDCDQVPVLDLGKVGRVHDARKGIGATDWMADMPLSTVRTSPLVPSCMCITQPCSCGTTLEPARYTGQPVETSTPDMALAWVDDNWLMIAGALGGLLLLSTMTRR